MQNKKLEMNSSPSIISQIQDSIFTYLDVKYTTINILINQNQYIHTIFIPTLHPSSNTKNYYIGHGFGGTSLTNFVFINNLIRKGNIILWQVRGMGFSQKLKKYKINEPQQIQTFFISTILALINHYKHTNCSFICHSFTSYLLLLFCIRYSQMSKKHIQKLILFSPIGITSAEEDKNNSLNNCIDLMTTIIHKCAWAFRISTKCVLRYLCCCCQKTIIQKYLQNIALSQKQLDLYIKIGQTLLSVPDGSQSLFYQYFLPRVIPKIALEPLLIHEPNIKIFLIFGGDLDWVDKSGGKKISERFPEWINFINIENGGHNIPADITLCKSILDTLL